MKFQYILPFLFFGIFGAYSQEKDSTFVKDSVLIKDSPLIKKSLGEGYLGKVFYFEKNLNHAFPYGEFLDYVGDFPKTLKVSYDFGSKDGIPDLEAYFEVLSFKSYQDFVIIPHANMIHQDIDRDGVSDVMVWDINGDGVFDSLLYEKGKKKDPSLIVRIKPNGKGI